MIDEPDNLIHKLLQEIRSTQKDHSEQLTAVATRLDHVDQRLEEIHETLFTVAGAAVHSNVRHDTVTERLKALEERIGRLEEKA